MKIYTHTYIRKYINMNVNTKTSRDIYVYIYTYNGTLSSLQLPGGPGDRHGALRRGAAHRVVQAVYLSSATENQPLPGTLFTYSLMVLPPDRRCNLLNCR